MGTSPLPPAQHHNPALLRLTVWPLPGRMAGKRAFPAELQNLSLAAINPPQGNLITHVCRIFSWCEETGLDPRSASLSRMADFFIHLFDKGLALPTIRAYRSAIAVIHKGFDDGTIVSNAPTLTKLFKAFFLSRPPKRRLLPSWSLPKVLEALAAPPFEPLATASIMNLTVKTVFLMAVASGHRRSTLHALSAASGHIRWERDGVRLIPRPDFIAKNQSASSRPVEIFLRPLSGFSSVTEDKLWCPVRALRWYLDRVKSYRKHEQLFLAVQEPHGPVSRDTVSRWIVKAIQAAGRDALIESSTPHAHDTRAISASWALFAGSPWKTFSRLPIGVLRTLSSPIIYGTFWLQRALSLERPWQLRLGPVLPPSPAVEEGRHPICVDLAQVSDSGWMAFYTLWIIGIRRDSIIHECKKPSIRFWSRPPSPLLSLATAGS